MGTGWTDSEGGVRELGFSSISCLLIGWKKQPPSEAGRMGGKPIVASAPGVGDREWQALLECVIVRHDFAVDV